MSVNDYLNDTAYHRPVMLRECLEALDLQPGGRYVDVTFGGGGHSARILEHLTTGHLYSFDQDADAEREASNLARPQFTFIRSNFRDLYTELKRHDALPVDGLLADLGVSSHQFDTPERGFSTRFDGPLDMRMNAEDGTTAADIIADYSEAELHRIFGMYGEVTNARTLAATVVAARRGQSITTIAALKKAISTCTPRGKENKYLAQVFQALRIEANDEMAALQEMLMQTAQVLRPGGRLVVMSYHSLEDRLVKNFMAKGKFFGEAEKNLFGHTNTPFEVLTRKPVEASAEEVALNPRARSAKLRVAVKKE
ncbi:16S rRNA (cytosine(1402)-N(4))-methyltransferase RsmH [Hymenobacter taeanensis]|uniref:Ribosomal RNA small subunit methyltransferase H n=1 Tax=Hymenobacter taeanensis TaxID=2735321 RepID=A0A6M6BJ80_9BACT|nr:MULTISPECIES: 16S rRNA (cytosine(1402)-N(4))-methyltransferase RsmH [Hymenobacter]QJX47874.1 16S rRNA (cytosine(1402)-N(4))-methyltransferase RsmH [Hymenobacter taeanensis]UOQ82685.1 16S rRNA (cytosine(1402)-N(4))-methyltransferase RsmH [Hymenobacter sp. 5414T-23]